MIRLHSNHVARPVVEPRDVESSSSAQVEDDLPIPWGDRRHRRFKELARVSGLVLDLIRLRTCLDVGRWVNAWQPVHDPDRTFRTTPLNETDTPLTGQLLLAGRSA